MTRLKIDFLGFSLAEELDIVGPFEVFGNVGDVADHDCELNILASSEVVVCRHGLRMLRTCPLDQKEGGTVLVVPGGKGARDPSKERSRTVDFLRTAHAGYKLILAVCTGTFLLNDAGILTNRVCTTHTLFQDELRQRGCTVVSNRVVQDGNVITSTGVTSGIDASLYVVTLLFGKSVAEKVVQRIEYPISVNQVLDMVHIISRDDQGTL